MRFLSMVPYTLRSGTNVGVFGGWHMHGYVTKRVMTNISQVSQFFGRVDFI